MIKFKEKPYTSEQVETILNPTVKKWFYSRFKEFSLPQLYAVREIHDRKNVLVSAPTGATKTLTAFLSILNELVDSAEKGILEDKVYAVYVSPLKALSNDISVNLLRPLDEINTIAGRDLGIRVSVRTGDTTTKEKADMLKNAPHILITTPESLSIMLTSPKFRAKLGNVEWLVVDEIHALAENKRGVHLSLSVESLTRLSDHMCRVGLSATISPLEEIARYLVGFKNVDGKMVENDCDIVNVQFIKELDLKVLSPVDDMVNVTHAELQRKMYVLLNDLISQHKTTLIFTNTRAATERVVHKLKDYFPKDYTESNIGAHHGSLSKEHRFKLESDLRAGKMKVAVCSTSLELGLDIGAIDLVILLGSPKSVARALQRVGRAGHQLHSVTKGRIVVLDRDDLVECSVLLKNAVEKKMDKVHIPTNCLDVLAQQIFGILIAEQMHIDDLFNMVRGSYCFNKLDRKDFMQVVNYLAGSYADLEVRHIYSKIWYNPENGLLGRKGKMGRVIYMTNIGTIPDSTGVIVKVGTSVVGTLDEGFLERLRPGDVFVLGGNTYQFKFARGMVAQVSASVTRPPTVPSWYSEMLPLSFDLAMEIGKFRRLMSEKFCSNLSASEIIDFINSYLYVDSRAAKSIYNYFKEQFDYSTIPSDKRIIIENYSDERGKYAIFHTLYGRRVNDCLSRAVAFGISRLYKKDVEIGITDNGFYVGVVGGVNALRAFKLLKAGEFYKILANALDKTEVLRRRFRHCAGRALMILRSYKGNKKRVGRQQVSSMILMSAVKQIDPDFCILKEARREVMEDLMDVDNAIKVLNAVGKDMIKIDEIETRVPTPFALNLVLQGYSDILKVEDKIDFLKRMHEMTIAKILLKKDGKKDNIAVSYDEVWEQAEAKRLEERSTTEFKLKEQVWNLEAPRFVKDVIVDLIDGGSVFSVRSDFWKGIKEYMAEVKKWPKDIRIFVLDKYDEYNTGYKS